MLRKDINLLYSFAQSGKKKNSSNMLIVIISAVVLIVGLMTFLFVNAKMNVAKNKEILSDLEQKLEQTDRLSQLQAQYNELKSAYETAIAEVIAEVAPGQFTDDAGKISAKLIDVLMPTAADGSIYFAVEIGSISIAGNMINIECAVSDYITAWDFTDYLAGNVLADAKYEELAGEIVKNKLRFSAVEENYPGLPQKPADGETGGSIDFVLKFTVDWEEFAE